MIIDITYDSSVANAPAGYKLAVQAAVTFFEKTFSTPITVNITVGWGEVDGQALGPDELGASLTTFVGPVGARPGSLGDALLDQVGLPSPAIAEAAENLEATAPVGITAAALPYAEARALLPGLFPADPSIPDGYVGLNSSAPFTFSASDRAVAGEYDAIGVLEHEISEVLGRDALEGAYPPGGNAANSSPEYTALDFLRWSAPGVHTYTAGGGYFSLNGQQLLLPFNNPSDGGDAGDWSTAAPADSFDAFAQPGVELAVSAVDLRVMEMLGYKVSDVAPTPSGIPTTPLTEMTNYSVAAGQTLNFNGPYVLILEDNAAVTNNGTIVDSGTRSQVDVVGIADQYAPNAPNTTFTNAANAVLSVTATAIAGDAAGAFGATAVTNSGLIQVVSDQADAWGVWGNSFTNTSTGALTVQALNDAIGVEYPNNGNAFSNAGKIEVTGLSATGVEVTASFNNSGTIEATGVGQGATSAAVYYFATGSETFTNSGLIQGGYAFQVDPNESGLFPTITIANSGTIQGIVSLPESIGQIDNTGSITGPIHFGDGNSVYNGVGGTQSGGIFLGYGTNIVTLGNDGEAVVGGGDADTITGGSGNDFIEIDLGNNTINGGGGSNTLSFADAPLAVTVNMSTGTAIADGLDSFQNIQEVIGGNYGNTMIAGSSAVTFVAGAGYDTLMGGAGNDTLIAGAGGDTMTGGGGNNTFIYSTGDHQLTVTDFGANGDQDVLQIYGYTAAQSIVQQGANTLVTLSANDSILLENVTASSLTPGEIVYKANPYQAPPVPVSPPIFGTTTINMDYNLTVLAGEVIDEANQNVGISDNANFSGTLNNLINFGELLVSSTTGNVSGMVSNETGGQDANITNEAGATFSVIDIDPAGTVTGINFDIDSFMNSGSFTVAGQGNALGINDYNDNVPITNAATGLFSVSSATGTATGLYLYNGDGAEGGQSVTNDGTFHVSGAAAAYGVATYDEDGQFAGMRFINNGTIVVSGTSNATETYGLYIAADSTITNTGTITAGIAIDGIGYPVGQGEPTFAITNSGIINGAIDIDAANTTIVNTGAVNGSITLGDGDSSYNGTGGTLAGVLSLGYGRNTVILGNDGESVIGGGGWDDITGGAGNDFIEIGRGYNIVNGGAGINTLSFADSDEAVTVNLGTGIATGAGTTKISNIQIVIGSSFNDTLIAGVSGATLIAGSGYDTLTGGAGNDTLVAGTGGDRTTGGGGDNTFIYSVGDRDLTITDFGITGTDDVLEIYGYSSAISVKQVGSYTVIRLSSTDTVTLDGVQASSLNASNVIFHAAPYQGQSVPTSPPVYFSSTAPINIDYALDDGLTIYSGETVHIVAQLNEFNENYAIQDMRFYPTGHIVPVLNNSGTIDVTSPDSGVTGVFVQFESSDGQITNGTRGVLNVSDAVGSAAAIVDQAFYQNLSDINNFGTITVSALTSALGCADAPFTNGATGVLDVTSSTADATGVGGSNIVVNNGAIVVSGATTATGILDVASAGSAGFQYGSIVNNGTITAETSASGGVTIGIDVNNNYFYEFQLEPITNNGTITAQTAIIASNTGYGDALLIVTNNGTINGAVSMGTSDSNVTNTGTINGNIIYLNETVFLASGPAVTNSGTIAGSIDMGASDATITNTGSIVGSTIQIITDDMLVSTQGSVELGSGLTAIVGTVGVGAGGTLSGSGTIDANLLTMAGATVESSGGTLFVSGNVSGTGDVLIEGASVLNIAGSVSATIEYAGSAGGMVVLHEPSEFTGAIAGIQAGDVVDLANIIATSATISSNVLIVKDNGGNAYDFGLSGNLSGYSFTIRSDGLGGSDLTLMSNAALTGHEVGGDPPGSNGSESFSNPGDSLFGETSPGEHTGAPAEPATQASDLNAFEELFVSLRLFDHGDHLG